MAIPNAERWPRGVPCVRSCGVPAFAVGTMAIPKESAVDTNSETVSSYAIGGAMTRARTTALLNFSQCTLRTQNKHEKASFAYTVLSDRVEKNMDCY